MKMAINAKGPGSKSWPCYFTSLKFHSLIYTIEIITFGLPPSPDYCEEQI